MESRRRSPGSVSRQVILLAVRWYLRFGLSHRDLEELAAKLPNSRVLRAFNTTFAGTLAAGTVGPQATTVLIAGDDADAKSTLAGVVTSGGLKAIDAGGLKRARELECLGFLQITLAANEKVSWTGGFGVVA